MITIGIDVGNNLGISIFNVNNKNKKINDIQTQLHKLDNYRKCDLIKLIQNTCEFTPTKHLNRTLYLQCIITNLLKKYNPELVSIENSFINLRFAKAGIVLSEYIQTIILCILNYNSDIKIMLFPPKYVKKIISSGDNTKSDMADKIKNIELLKKPLAKMHKLYKLKDMSEHEIDSIAINYCGYCVKLQI